jgi:hypothetical protein
LIADTGWFYGTIPNVGLTETTYTFAVQVMKADDNTIKSPLTYFTITIIGNIDTDVTWAYANNNSWHNH